MLHHPRQDDLEFFDSPGHVADLTEVAVVMHSPGLRSAAIEEISEVLMLVASFVEDVGFLGRLETHGAVVLNDLEVVKTHSAALLRKRGQLIDQQRELDGQLVIGVAEQSNNAEESLCEFGFLLEALEDATDVEYLWLFGLRAFVV